MTDRMIKDNVRVFFTWVLLVFGMLVGCSFAFGSQDTAVRILGVVMLIAAAAALGPWLLWVNRIAVRDRTFVRCDNCEAEGTMKGRHRLS